MYNKESLFNIIDKYNQFNILVIGDIILDEYIWGRATRLSPEAPVPVLDVKEHSYILGGAANVANNITALKGNVFLCGIIGDDTYGKELTDILNNTGINISCLISDKKRPTTVKTRLIAHNHQQLARVDREQRTPINNSIEEKISTKVLKIINSVDLVVFSDYAKGVLTHSLCQNIIQLAQNYKKPVLVDPKGLDYTKYAGATLITPNRQEAETATKSPIDTSPEKLANALYETLNIANILVTLGEDGILLYNDGGEITRIPAVTSEVYDVTGAGDSLLSALALSIPASDNNLEASIALGNYSAGVAVRKIGTTTVSPDELKNIIKHDLLEKPEAPVRHEKAFIHKRTK
ncbi:MAG: D-glycero-beta-D-manno-heptose-7-phosphate kinase [Candidatus Gastranaerophilales bacterium]|nr:D-glycero-beta-D-manno-heptose-7-phosphate kinase [Candidatus Gastranaerophilales bacterium]